MSEENEEKLPFEEPIEDAVVVVENAPRQAENVIKCPPPQPLPGCQWQNYQQPARPNFYFCQECGKEISRKAKACPHCGNPISSSSKSTEHSGCAIVLVVILGILAVFSVFLNPFAALVLLLIAGGVMLLDKVNL